MRKQRILISTAIVLAVVFSGYMGHSLYQKIKRSQPFKVRITVLSENNTCGYRGVKSEAGLGFLIEKNGRQYLYDAGRSGIIVTNAKIMRKDLKRTGILFLSHGHMDHTSGLDQVLQAIGHPVEIIAHPSIFEEKRATKDGKTISIGMPHTKKYLEDKYQTAFKLQKGFYQAAEGLWLTGEVPMTNKLEDIPQGAHVKTWLILEKDDTILDDNTLVIDTDKGLVVLLGCGHRGMMNILTYIKKNLKKNIYAVIGGTHLEAGDKEQITYVKNALKQFFEQEHTQVFAPNHCTGSRRIAEFKKEFPRIFHDASCGTTLEF